MAYELEPIDIEGIARRRARSREGEQSGADFSLSPSLAVDDSPRGSGSVSAPQGSSAADVASSGLAMSGNPVAMGVGLGLQVLSSQQKRAQEQENLKTEMELGRKREMRDAIGSVIKTMQRRLV